MVKRCVQSRKCTPAVATHRSSKGLRKKLQLHFDKLCLVERLSVRPTYFTVPPESWATVGCFCLVGCCVTRWTVFRHPKSRDIWETFCPHLFSSVFFLFCFLWLALVLWCHFLFEKVFACRKCAGCTKRFGFHQWRCRGSGGPLSRSFNLRVIWHCTVPPTLSAGDGRCTVGWGWIQEKWTHLRV